MDPLPIIPKTLKVILKFNPETTEDKTVRQVFSDRIARNLWIGLKWRHLTCEHFSEGCLKIAEQIRQTPPQTPGDLRSIFVQRGRDPIFHGPNACTEELAGELLPYVNGSLDFSYEVA